MASSDTQPNVSAADAGYRPQSDALRDAGVPNTDDAAHDAGETLVPGPNTEVTSAPDPTTFTPEPQAPCSVACEAPEHGTAQCDGAVCSVVCDSEFEWCTDRCVDTQTSVSDCGSCGVPCPTGHVCVGGECALDCQNGTEQCSGACVDTAHDVENCGECGTKCEARGSGSPVCNDGRCERDCGNGKTDCDGECVDLSKDEDNCGTCGNYCLLGKCADGECSLLGL